MTFWNWRRGTGAPATSSATAVATGNDLAPIELYTADARIVGWISASGQRVTDLLNAEDELHLWRPSPGPLDGAGANGAKANGTNGTRPRTSDAPDGAPETGEWQTLATDQVIVAMPPEWRASRQLRLHRRLRRVALSAGPFNVTGNVHLPPGTEAGPALLSQGPRWLPLTEAYLLHTADPPFEHVVSVVIVNTAHVGQLTPLVSLA